VYVLSPEQKVVAVCGHRFCIPSTENEVYFSSLWLYRAYVRPLNIDYKLIKM
jgi:hypothetical protein